MAEAHFETRFAAAPLRVFAVLSDLSSAAAHLKQVTALERLTPGPVGLGTKFSETRRVWGREHTQVLCITRFESPSRLTLAVEKPSMTTASDFQLSPDGAGTRVRFGLDVQDHTFLAKAFVLLLFPLLARAIQGAARHDLEDLRATIEGRGGASSGEDGLPDAPEEARG